MQKIILTFITWAVLSFNPLYAGVNEEGVSEADSVAERVVNGRFSCPAGSTPDERGWWWGCVELKPEVPVDPQQITQAKPTEQQKEELCSNPETWDAVECGFVNPNKIKDYQKAFEFQKQQQQQLSRRMVMEPQNEKAVKDYQEYTKWWMRQSVMVLRTWKFNMVQNPDLDPRLKQPISTYGLRMATEVENADKDSVFSILKDEGAAFIWFTSSSCPYCHNSRKIIKKVGLETGLDVYNVSIDDKCIEGFEGKFCRTRDKEVEHVAAKLDVRYFPTLFMYIPNDKEIGESGGSWIRIANGIEVVSTIVDRTYRFMKAYKSAIQKNLASALENQPAMDWEYDKATGIAEVDIEKEAP